MIRSIRPGRGDITMTRSASRTASSMQWVMNSDRSCVLQPQLLKVDPHLLAGQRVERAERLVHQQEGWIVDQRAHDRGALAHAAGKLVRIAVCEILEADRGEQAARALAIGARIEPAQLDLEEDVAEHRAPVEQHRSLEHDAEPVCGPVDDCARRRAPRPASAGCRPAIEAQQRALAAARRTDDGEELASSRIVKVDAGRARASRSSPRAIDLGDARDFDMLVARAAAPTPAPARRRGPAGLAGPRALTAAGIRWCGTWSTSCRS